MRSIDVDNDRVLPSNVEDPRFTRADADVDADPNPGWTCWTGWTAPDSEVQWPDVVRALLESLPVVVSQLWR